MAITSSAKKAIRAAAHRRIFNLRRKDAILSAKKNIQKLVKSGKTADAKAFLPKMYKAIDKAAKTKYIKKNTATRMKSRIAAFVNKHIKK